MADQRLVDIPSESGCSRERPSLADAGCVCHEIRKPISAIKAFAEILADGLSGPLNQSQQEHVATILRNTERLNEQISSAFELAEALSGRLALSLERCDLMALCSELRNELANDFQARGIHLVFEAPAGELYEQVDEHRLRRTVRRLLEHARVVSKQGGRVVLSIERRGGELLVSVLDDGRWEPEAPRASSGKEEDGAWCGREFELFLCHAVSTAHGGALHVESSDDGRTRYRIHLPSIDGRDAVRATGRKRA